MNEYEIIEKLKNKDRMAFKLFVDLNKDKIVNLCFGFLHNLQDSEDVAQETFIEVFASIRNFKAESSLNTWIYRIAVNKSLDFIKSKKRKKRAGILLSYLGLSNRDSMFLQNKDNPERLLEQNENSKIIKTALDNLPENQKAALTLSKFEDMSYKEIAAILGVSDSAVDSLIQRAKKNIKKYLQSEGFLD